MRPEQKIEEAAVSLAELHGWKAIKVTSPGVRGRLDRLFIKGGRHVWIEYKRPGLGCRPSPLQADELEDLLAHGAEAYVHDSVAATAKVLGIPYA